MTYLRASQGLFCYASSSDQLAGELTRLSEEFVSLGGIRRKYSVSITIDIRPSSVHT